MNSSQAVLHSNGTTHSQPVHVNQLLREAVDKLPSSLVITHAIDFFNLGDNPKWAIIPERVKWQILHAASAFKDGCGKIHLSAKDFSIEHLNIDELAILYRIIRSYHFNRELNIYGQHAMFHKHIECIEARFMLICHASYQDGQEALEVLRSYDDESLAPFTLKIEGILKAIPKPLLQPETIDYKIGRAIHRTTQEMNQNRFNPTYPSGLLLLFADQHYNLTNRSENQPRIPDEVKWQLLNASKAYKDKETKVVRLGADFSYEHLKLEHLTVLLTILTAYHDFEKNARGVPNAIFSKHIFLMESHLEDLCWRDSAKGESIIHTLKGTQNTVLNPFIQKLEKILANKDRYLALPQLFQLYPNLFGLFTAPNPTTLKIVLTVYGPKGVMVKVKDNYDVFLRWMKTISDMEALEKDPVLQKAVRRWKSEIQERFYNKHFTMLCQITEAYPEYFHDTLAGGGSLAILNNGARIMLEKFQDKGSIQGNLVVCSSYEEYKEKLIEIANGEACDGQWYISIRCEQRTPLVYNVHQTGAYIERSGDKVFVQILDATPYDFDNGPYKVASLTKDVFPNAIMNSTMVARQRDFNNCSFFMFNDMKAISRNKDNILWLREKSINILQYVEGKYGKDVSVFWQNKAPQANKDVNVTGEIPLEFVTPTQSLSEVEKALKANQGPSSPEIVKKIRQKVARHKLIELSQDSAVTGNDVSGYAKLKSMKYRLYIAQQAFPAASI